MRKDFEEVTEGLGFEFAILAIKSGKRVRRSSWSQGICLYKSVLPAWQEVTEDVLANDWELF